MIINEVNKDKVMEFLKSSISKSKFYMEKYSNIKISEYCEIPYLTQEEIGKNSENMKSDEKFFRTSISSGTTGQPKILFRTESDFNTSVKNQINLMKWCGIDESDVIGIVQPFGLCAYGSLTLEACRKMGVFAVPIGTVDTKFILEYIRIFKITVLDIAPSKFIDLIKEINKKSVKINLKLAMVAGEPLPESLVRNAKETLGCEIYNQYGTEELDALAGAARPGESMKLLESDFLFELKDPKEIHTDQVMGELVVTSLYHTGTPIIKYATGDMALWNKKSNEIKIIGRNCEHYNIYDSVLIYPFQIECFFSITGINIMNWQCERFQEDKQTKLKFYLSSEKLSNKDIMILKKKFSEINPEINDLINSGRMIVEFEEVDSMRFGKSRKQQRFL